MDGGDYGSHSVRLPNAFFFDGWKAKKKGRRVEKHKKKKKYPRIRKDK